MISLKLDHSHPHKLPCHPTRAYFQEQASINETDRQHLSDEDDKQPEDSRSHDPNQFKIIESRAFDSLTQSQVSSPLLKPRMKKKVIATVEDAYHADVIQQSFQGSIKMLPINIRSLVMQKQKFIEDKVYLGLIDNNTNVLQRVYKQIDGETHFKDRVKENIIEMMGDIHSKFETEIRYSDKFIIHKLVRSTKDDILLNRRSHHRDTSSVTFNSNKVDEQSINSQSQVPSHEEFSLKSQKTKKAEVFIKKIQKEQEEIRRKRAEEQQRKRSLEVKSMEEKKEFEQEIKNERKNYLRRRIQAKQQIKQKQLEVREKMNKEYKQFLKKYKQKTPLFKKNEKMYEEKSREEEKMKEFILEKRKEQRRPMRLDEIMEHEKKYKLIKMDKQEQKNSEKKMKQEMTQNIKYYKSKCHEELLKEAEREKERIEREDPKLLRSELIKKRDVYSESVRKNFVPKSDEAKQKQLKALMQKLQWSQDLKKGKKDDRMYYAEGNKNLQRLHQLIADLRSKGKLPLVAQTISYEQSTPQKAKPRYENYLEENHRHRKSLSTTIDYDKIADRDMEEAGRRAVKAEQQAKRREVYLQSSSLDLRRSMEESKKLDDDYLESVRAKMALLNKIE